MSFNLGDGVGNVTQLLDVMTLGGVTTHRLVEGKSAAAMLKEIHKILVDAKELMVEHRSILPSHQYDDFQVTYRRLKRESCEENTHSRLTEDERIRTSRILSRVYKDRTTHRERVGQLLNKTEIFHGTVLQASRTADGEEAFPDEVPTTQQTKQSSVFDHITTWFGLSSSSVPSISSGPDHSEEGQIPITESSILEPTIGGGRRYLACVTHIQQEPSDYNGIRRMITLEGYNKQVCVIDPEILPAGSHDPLTDRESLLALAAAAEDILQKTHAISTEATPINSSTTIGNVINTFNDHAQVPMVA